jgi:hypothetical protein
MVRVAVAIEWIEAGRIRRALIRYRGQDHAVAAVAGQRERCESGAEPRRRLRHVAQLESKEIVLAFVDVRFGHAELPDETGQPV